MALTQYAYRFQNDDGTESGATNAASENTSVDLTPGQSVRVRLGVDASGDPSSKTFQLEYRYKPAGGSFGSWAAVPSTFWNTLVTAYWDTAVTTYWNKQLDSGAM
jgi:hypothetical protein